MYVFLTIKLSKYNNTSSLFECKHTLLGRRIKDTQNVQEPLESLILTNFCIKPCLSFYNQDLWAKNHYVRDTTYQHSIRKPSFSNTGNFEANEKYHIRVHFSFFIATIKTKCIDLHDHLESSRRNRIP